MNKITKSIEAILFATSEPVSILNLMKILEVDENSIQESINDLENSLENHGLMLIKKDNLVNLVTRPEESTIIESIRKEELSKELSKASAETLAIIIYYTGINKSQIEFIRGVNASYTIRSLLMRGLIEARQNGRQSFYYPTINLLQEFGISKIEDLPEYNETKLKITNLLKDSE